ncbi:penicillin-binding transpeptidase domain-containing protein [Vallitalea sp.]|uniref:penicillin-binding transpeptidase domain-containing protein n=1 Tax=Vallitalea sp. TaxID=1882829 RepID=UPI0025F1F016|nr:penicillin-binding transpeptidase domain-containing protein [Vallitalea sp.]MCT4688916.1 penicillin-binding transpeptidase domain-containing protein [Vallitalea sp.]
MIHELLLNVWKIIKHRLFILLVFILLIFWVLINRIFELQIVKGQELANQFSIKSKRNIVLEGTRGNIYDRNGIPLAINELAYSVTLDDSIPVEDRGIMIRDLINVIEENGDNIIVTFPIKLRDDEEFEFVGSNSSIVRFKKEIFGKKRLSKVQESLTAEDMIKFIRSDDFFNMPVEKYSDEEVVKICAIRYALYLTRGSKFKPLKVAVDISQKTLAMINENQDKFPGAKIIVEPRRQYIDSTYFSHIIGYTKTISPGQLEKLKVHGYNARDIVGQAGIEKEMEIYLKGTDGKQTIEVDNLGRTRNIISTEEPEPGKDVFLTIDKELQMKTYDALEKQIANVVVEKIYTKQPSKKGIYILLKDVFASLFHNNTISLEKLEYSSEEQYQNNIYSSFIKHYNKVVNDINYNLANDVNQYLSEEDRYLDYIIDNLVSDGILLTRKKVEADDGKKEEEIEVKIEVYKQYENNEISINELINTSIKEKSVIIDKKEGENPTDIEIYNYIIDYINKKVLENDFKRLVYTTMAENGKFFYRDLCFMLIEQGIVTSNEKEMSDLIRGKFSALNFMKSKITNLDIKPSQLALDPSTGSAVVVDVKTGEVLSLVSYPSYDNNKFVNKFDTSYYYKVINDPTTPLVHRATTERRAPGSTFKMVSAMAGLEEGVINKNTVIRDLGVFNKISPPAKCWVYTAYGSTHGNETVAEALRDSCNYFFYEVGLRLGKDDEGNYIPIEGINKLMKYVEKFGLDTKSGIELSEYSPKNPTKDPVRAAIGQDKNSYTPVQLARYISTLANGGTNFELNIVDKISSHSGEVYEDRTPNIATKSDFDPENIKMVHSGMLKVTTKQNGVRGTAYSIFKDLPIKVAGKTGTSQESKSRPDHATFTAFAPYDDPEIAVVVVIPFGYTAQNSGKVVKEIISNYYDLYGTSETTTMSNKLEY